MTTPELRHRALVVGFIGLGDQGAPMAQAIADSDFALRVWARRPESQQVLDGFAYASAADPAELTAGVDVLALCLRDDRDVWTSSTRSPSANRSSPPSPDRSHMGPGPSGSGQTAKLFNNAMTMSNLKNAVDLIRLATQVDIDVKAAIEVIGASSGASTILRTLSTDLTVEIAPHIQSLMRKDIEHFADAFRAQGLDPHELRDRGLAGADGLLEAVTLLAAGTSAA
jgi:3-hydroxyisobutyrate dehydrogenase-like beta-hydroxyacid dehydrogenase